MAAAATLSAVRRGSAQPLRRRRPRRPCEVRRHGEAARRRATARRAGGADDLGPRSLPGAPGLSLPRSEPSAGAQCARGLRDWGTGQAMAARDPRCTRLDWARNVLLCWVAPMSGAVRAWWTWSAALPAVQPAGVGHGELSRLSSLLFRVRHLLYTLPLRPNTRSCRGSWSLPCSSWEKGGLNLAGLPALQAIILQLVRGNPAPHVQSPSTKLLKR